MTMYIQLSMLVNINHSLDVNNFSRQCNSVPRALTTFSFNPIAPQLLIKQHIEAPAVMITLRYVPVSLTESGTVNVALSTPKHNGVPVNITT